MKWAYLLTAAALALAGCATDQAAEERYNGFIAGTEGGPTPYESTAQDVADLEAMDEAELAAFETSLEDSVSGALQRASSIDSGGIDVLVDGNQVTLQGRVPTERQKQFAGEVASSVEGVGSIRNDLIIR